jgi:hypothetical protein
MNNNKRSSIRKPLDFYVDVYRFDVHLGHTQIRDISLDGAFIESCSRELCPNDMIELHIHAHDVERSPLRLNATVVRSSDMGVGVQFDYGVLEYRRLLNIISTYAFDGHILEIPGFWYVSSSVN